MKSIQLACATGVWLIFGLNPSWSHETSTKPTNAVAMTDEQSIEHAMKSLFDKPGSPLKVAPVSVEGAYAVAGWIQNNRGGRALLKKENGKWLIMVCGGDDLKKAQTLSMTGITPSSATKLAQKISAAEKHLSTDELNKLSMFDRIIRVDGSTHDPHTKKSIEATNPINIKNEHQ